MDGNGGKSEAYPGPGRADQLYALRFLPPRLPHLPGNRPGGRLSPGTDRLDEGCSRRVDDTGSGIRRPDESMPGLPSLRTRLPRWCEVRPPVGTSPGGGGGTCSQVPPGPGDAHLLLSPSLPETGLAALGRCLDGLLPTLRPTLAVP
jgi:hypothetical protein